VGGRQGLRTQGELRGAPREGMVDHVGRQRHKERGKDWRQGEKWDDNKRK
jgi:hypothetical protein